MKILSKGESKVHSPEAVEQPEQLEGVPICYSNLTTPVTEKANYIDEIRYKIGERLYIENAD